MTRRAVWLIILLLLRPIITVFMDFLLL
jgi:hypothetical protein